MHSYNNVVFLYIFFLYSFIHFKIQKFKTAFQTVYKDLQFTVVKFGMKYWHSNCVFIFGKLADSVKYITI